MDDFTFDFNSEPDWDNIFTQSPTGNTSAPNDTLAQNLDKGLSSVGNATSDFFSKTADLFAKGLGLFAQGAQAYDVITAQGNSKPQTPVAQSQLPSLQGQQNTTPMLQSFLNLRSALDSVFTSNKSSNLTPQANSVLPTILLVGVILVAGYFLMRAE